MSRAAVAVGLVAGGVVAAVGLWVWFAATTQPVPPTDLMNSIGMRFRRVPAGTFLMGAAPGDDAAEQDERPQHEVVLTRSFLIGQFEVTQEQYERVTGENPSWFRPGGEGADRLGSWSDTSRFPVESVSWTEAVAFCEALSALPEERRAGRRYRLPTEAEWEYACRAGTTTRFAFGDAFRPRFANMNEVRDRPVEVGSYPPNDFGLFDMHGNVLEWCHDWHSDTYYAESPRVDPLGPEQPDADHRVLRGGGWAFEAASCSFRDRIPTQLKGASHGFRVVCELVGPAAVENESPRP